MLATKPLRSELQQRPGPGNKKLTYLSGDSVTRTLNDVFGFDGWCLEVKETRRESCDKDDKNRHHVSYTALVRVTHRQSGAFKEDCGAGDMVDKSLATAISFALKASVTDALKRAVRHFGDKLGNSLYESTFSASKAPTSLKEALANHDIERAKSKFGFAKDRIKAEVGGVGVGGGSDNITAAAACVATPAGKAGNGNGVGVIRGQQQQHQPQPPHQTPLQQASVSRMNMSMNVNVNSSSSAAGNANTNALNSNTAKQTSTNASTMNTNIYNTSTSSTGTIKTSTNMNMPNQSGTVVHQSASAYKPVTTAAAVAATTAATTTATATGNPSPKAMTGSVGGAIPYNTASRKLDTSPNGLSRFQQTPIQQQQQQQYQQQQPYKPYFPATSNPHQNHQPPSIASSSVVTTMQHQHQHQASSSSAPPFANRPRTSQGSSNQQAPIPSISMQRQYHQSASLSGQNTNANANANVNAIALSDITSAANSGMTLTSQNLNGKRVMGNDGNQALVPKKMMPSNPYSQAKK